MHNQTFTDDSECSGMTGLLRTRLQNSGGARTVRVCCSDDEICVTRTVRCPLRTRTK